MIEVTQPDLSDLNVLAALKREVHELHVSQAGWLFHPVGRDELAEMIRGRFADDCARVFVARSGGHVIGYVAASLRIRPATPISREYRALYLDEICVRPDQRKQGAGRLLVERLLAAAQEEGTERVELDAWAFNTAAASFFEKLGFQPQLQRFGLSLARA